MPLKNIEEIGYISKLHGIRGELKIKLTSFSLEFNEIPKYFVLQKAENLLPVEILIIKQNGEDLTVGLNGIDTLEKAKNYIGYTVLVDKKHIVENPLVKLANDIVGYKVIDENLGPIGIVEGLDIEAIQAMLIVSFEKKEILIPFVQDVIVKEISTETCTIHVCTPDGLLTIN